MNQSETKSSLPKMDPQKFTVDTRYNEIPINCIFQGITKYKQTQIFTNKELFLYTRKLSC